MPIMRRHEVPLHVALRRHGTYCRLGTNTRRKKRGMGAVAQALAPFTLVDGRFRGTGTQASAQTPGHGEQG